MARVALGQFSIEVAIEGSGEAVLLLHGFPTTNLLWREVSPRLAAAGYRTISPDLVGFGRSEAPKGLDLHMTNQAQWMLELMDAVGVEHSFVVAHDVGSAAAQIMVARAPERVRALVLIDGVHGDQWGMEAVESIRSFDPSAASRLFQLLVRRIRRQWTTSDIPEDVIRQMMAPYEGQDGGERLIRMAQSLDPKHTVAIVEELKRRPVPSLVLWGDRDPFLSVDGVARPLADLLHAKLQILAGGHFLPMDQPEAVSEEIIRFFKNS
jgi:pimeloyl-ACP methyl ester carboxylesterase